MVLSVAKVGPSKEAKAGIPLCKLALSAFSSVLLVPVRVQLKEFLMDFLDRPVQESCRAPGCYLDFPLRYDHTIPFDGGLQLRRLRNKLIADFDGMAPRGSYIAKQRCRSDESVGKLHDDSLVQKDMIEEVVY